MINSCKTKFKHFENLHKIVCKRRVKDKIYTGVATCHPEDYDFESNLVGEHYAYVRSLIDEMCHDRDEYLAQLKILRHIYDIYEQNPAINYDSHECYILRRQIRILEEDIAEIRVLIKETKANLRNLISEKDKMYNKMRNLREKQKALDAVE